MIGCLRQSRERLEQNEKLEKMSNWQKSNLIIITVPIGDTLIYTEARFVFRTDGNGDNGTTCHYGQ